MALLEIIGLNKKYQDRYALKNINLKIEGGEVFTLIGPTGAGKTTLLRLLDLLEAPTSGNIYFDGVDVTHPGRHRLEARRRMAFVQQKPVVFDMSVYDNVACGLRWRRMNGNVIRRRVTGVLELVGMADYSNGNARTLSGGETQRVAIARALVTEPEVLFLDEPTANMDPVSALKIEEVLAQIIQEKKITVVMSTHDMLQGQRLASRIGVLIDGEIMQTGSPGAVFTSPKNTRVAEFVGVENILEGVVTARDDSLITVSLETSDSTVQAISDSAVGERVYVLIRPEDITISLSHDTSSARNVFKGKIAKVIPTGPLARVEMDCGFPLLGLITRKSAEELSLTAGREVYAGFKATAIRIIRSIQRR